MKRVLALIAGTVFGLGLSLSGMTDPQKVIGFLDLAGAWQPTLAFVMGGGLLITFPAFALIRRSRRVPLLEHQFYLPTRSSLDRQLLIGAALFGTGWGVAGFCPGPAIASLAGGSPIILVFCLSMAAGMLIAHLFERKPARAEAQLAR